MLLAYSKIIVAILMSAVTFVASILPLCIIRWIRRGVDTNIPRRFRIVSCLSCFGGGVFIATCLLHLFPEVSEQIALVCKTLNYDTEFPIAEFLLCLGFLAVLVCEQIVLNCKESSSPERQHILNIKNDSNQSYGTINNSSQDTDAVVILDLGSPSTMRSLMLIFALSLHSIFEGLAIGLQSSTENVMRILFAVLVHKCIIAFTLGLDLTNSNTNQADTIKELIFFALTSPVGVIIGSVVVDFVTGLPMMISSAILQGLAAGTFLYVTFFEVLPEELKIGEDRMLKMISLLFGFSVVSILQMYLPS